MPEVLGACLQQVQQSCQLLLACCWAIAAEVSGAGDHTVPDKSSQRHTYSQRHDES